MSDGDIGTNIFEFIRVNQRNRKQKFSSNEKYFWELRFKS